MSIQQMNVHDCIRCGNPINYDDTDWCDVCDMSIFDDRMVKRKKILTIENFKSSLLNSWWGGWKVKDILEDVYKTDDKLFIKGPKHYSVRFVYYRADGIGSHSGTMLLAREEDDFLKGRYRVELWLNGKLFLTDAVHKRALEDRTLFIKSIVDTIDYQLRNPC